MNFGTAPLGGFRVQQDGPGDAPFYYRFTADDALKQQQAGQAAQQMWQSRALFPMQQQRQEMLNGMLGKMVGTLGDGQSMFNANSRGMMPPAPHYIGAGPVWNQGQIDAQSNLQRSVLQRQAATQTQDFTQGLGASGFSPMSPLAGIVGTQNMMAANAGAAANETGLNFNAAKANSDARLQAAGVNADMYGKYVTSLPNYYQAQAQAGNQSRQNQLQLMQMILGAMHS